MKKTLFKIKKNNELIEKLKMGNPEDDAKATERVRMLSRASKLARNAAKKAEENGDNATADKLNKRADDLDDLIRNADVDTLDQDEESRGKGDSGSGEEEPGDLDNKGEGEDNGEGNGEGEEDGEEGDGEGGGGKNSGGKGTDKKQQDSGKGSNGQSGEEDGSTDDNGSDVFTDLSGDGGNGVGGRGDGGKPSGKQGGKGNNQNNKNKGKPDKNNKPEGCDPGTPKPPEVENPFEKQMQIPGLPGFPPGEPPRKPTQEEIIEILGKLTGEARRGAIDGLKALLKNGAGGGSTNESLIRLSEKLRPMRDMTDDEFAEVINDTIDMVNKVTPMVYKEPETQIGASFDEIIQDPAARRDILGELTAPAIDAKQKIKGREAELEKYKNLKGFSSFKINFYRAINDQVDYIRQQRRTYMEPVPEYSNTNIRVKGIQRHKELDEAKPHVVVYVDQSASFGERDVQVARKIVATVKEFQDSGEITMEVLYFADSISNDPRVVRGEGGTSALPKIISNIAASNTNNVVIISDGDMEWQPDRKISQGVKVEGCVWCLWRNGTRAPRVPALIRGRGGNYEYSYTTADA